MLNILFEPSDNIEIRCLHKDQVMKQGKYEPHPYSFFGNFNELRTDAMFKKLTKLNQDGYNIYYGAHPRHGNSKTAVTCCRSLFVDLDGGGHHMDHAEAMSWLNAVMADWCVPYPTLVINSGNGIHFYWRLAEAVSPADFHKAQKALIHTFNLTNKIADPCIHDPQRIMRLPGFANCRGGVVAEVLEQTEMRPTLSDFELCFSNIPPEKVAQVDPNYKGENEQAFERAQKYFEKREGISEGGRNNEAYKIAICCFNDFGLNESDVIQIVSGWNLRNRPPLNEAELMSVIKKAGKRAAPDYSKDRPKPDNRGQGPSREYPSPEPSCPTPPPAAKPEQSRKRNPDGIDLEVVEYMVKNYVLVAGTTDVWDLEHGILMPVSALSLLYPKEIKYWKNDFNRQVVMSDDLVFEPSGKTKEGQINTFRGFSFREDKRPMPLLISHIEMLCGGDDQVFTWVLSWMAFQVQNPGVKLATSIIMHGKQGTGKSLLWECFGSIFDPYFAIIDQSVLESDFNAWASRKTFVLAEEVLANRSKSKLKNVIKQMITGGRIQINQKFSKPWFERCYMNMVFNSNNRLPMLLDEDDRRFTVIKCDHKESDDYFSALAAEIEDNGPARLYHFLKTWDLQGFHAHTKPPLTDAKAELIMLTRDSCGQFLDDWLSESIDDLPVSVAKKQDLYDAYLAYCKMSGLRSCSKYHFYGVVQEEYPQISEGRWSNYRTFIPDNLGNASPLPFAEALNRLICRIQDRRI